MLERAFVEIIEVGKERVITVAELAMRGVKKSFMSGSLTTDVLSDITAQFVQDATYAFTGVSGTGKSTCMHILAGIETPSAGTVSFNGRDINAFSLLERSFFLSQSVGLMFQQPYLISELSVVENIIVPGLIVGNDKQWCLEEAAPLLAELGLAHKMHSKPASLSGGQQQRVALARALFNKPYFLLADEPTGNLDNKTGREIVSLLLACRAKWGMGIIVSTHDMYLADAIEIVYEIKDGVLQRIA